MTPPARTSARNPLETRRGRLTVFFLLYLSEGLPLGLSLFALPAYFRLEGVSVSAIGGFMAAVMAPWALKWLWAPLIDVIRVERFGPNRFWIVVTQSMMAMTLVFLFVLDPAEDLLLLTGLLVIHNVFSSAQDVAIDGFAVRILPASELNWANGLMFSAQYLGMAVGSGGALFLAARFGFSWAFALVLGGLLALLFGVSLRLREPEGESGSQEGRRLGTGAIAKRLREFFRELYIGFFRSGLGPRVGVVFGILPQGAMALAYGIASTLQVDLGFSEDQIAVNTVLGLLGGAAGCAAAGPLGDRFGARRLLGWSYALTALPTVALGAMIFAWGLEGVTLMHYMPCALLYNLAYGLSFGIIAAVYMSLTNPAVGATQFTGYMALRNAAISYSAYWQGLAVAGLGYGAMFGIDSLVALVPIALIPFLRPSPVWAGKS